MQAEEQTSVDSLAARRPGLVFLKKKLFGLEKDSNAPAKKEGVGFLVPGLVG